MKIRKNRKLKIICYILSFLASVATVFILLLLNSSADFIISDSTGNSGISRYLTHAIAPDFYNGAQRQLPFDLVITQTGANDIIASYPWPKRFDNISFSTPGVFFVPDNMVLMTTATVSGIKLAVTIVVKPIFEDGLLRLSIAKVKVGSLSMTFITKGIAERMYSKRVADSDVVDIWLQLAASLLDDELFAPVFKAEDKFVRLKNVTVSQSRLTAHFVPAITAKNKAAK